jgi:plastocyanin
MRRALAVLGVFAVVAFAGLAIAACDDGRGNHMNDQTMMDHGGGNGEGANSPLTPDAREIRVSSDTFSFSPEKITLDAGEAVTIVLTSDDIFHDFVVEGQGHIVGAKGGQTAKGGLRIDEPGTYTFWCSVPGHRSAGMEGTIVVR